MLYLIEKYAPCDGIDKYDPGKDAFLTGATLSLAEPESWIWEDGLVMGRSSLMSLVMKLWTELER